MQIRGMSTTFAGVEQALVKLMAVGCSFADLLLLAASLQPHSKLLLVHHCCFFRMPEFHCLLF
jgi:hypothetical protein